MIEYTIIACFLITGIINFLPVVGVSSKAGLQEMYGITIADSNLLLLLQHRAILFGLLGGFILCASLVPTYRLAAFVLGFVSMISFLVLAWKVGNTNQSIRKVVVVDIVGIVAFSVAAVLHFFYS